MRSQQTAALILMCSALVHCSSASDSTPEPSANAQKSKAQSPNQANPNDQKSPVASAPFSYTSVGKRDPFRSYLIDLANENKARNFGRKLEETESFELDQYHLGGLITGISQPKAMLEDPTGHGYVIHVGSRVGKNGGIVTQIDTQGVLVIEETHDPLGKVIRLPIRIRLPQTDYEDFGTR